MFKINLFLINCSFLTLGSLALANGACDVRAHQSALAVSLIGDLSHKPNDKVSILNSYSAEAINLGNSLSTRCQANRDEENFRSDFLDLVRFSMILESLAQVSQKQVPNQEVLIQALLAKGLLIPAEARSLNTQNSKYPFLISVKRILDQLCAK